MANVGIQSGEGRTLLHVPIDASNGTQTLVAGVANKKIKIVGYVVVGSANCTVQFADTTGILTGAMDCAQYGGMVAKGSPSVPWQETRLGEPLKLVTTAAVNGHLSYILE